MSTDGLAGKAALVTGASSGIGLAIAERLAADGARLVLVAAPQDESALAAAIDSLERAGAETSAVTGDVGDPDTAEEAVAEAVRRYGRLDLLAANAGIGYFDEALETPLEHLDRTLHVNVRGVWLTAKAAANAMADGTGGAIVCTASTASYFGEEYQATYNASKGAVASIARSLAVDLAPYRIRVNAVAPGWVRTRATEAILADARQWSKHRSRIPLDRAADPSEVAEVVSFLLGERASYVTGAVVFCDGGLTAGYRFSDWDAVPTEPGPRPPRRRA